MKTKTANVVIQITYTETKKLTIEDIVNEMDYSLKHPNIKETEVLDYEEIEGTNA